MAIPPDGVSLPADSLWIELDVAQWKPGTVDGAELPVEALEPDDP